MTDNDQTTDDALDRLSVAPDAPEEGSNVRDPRQDAGQDRSIAKRLEKDPANNQAQLDNALDESMDASDPPAATQPVHPHEPPASSGYDAEAEAQRARDNK